MDDALDDGAELLPSAAKAPGAPGGSAAPALPEGAHCLQCWAYEGSVMAMGPGDELDAAITPCPQYAMSPPFREHLVAKMRSEMGGQISAAGLDRMALAKLGRRDVPGSAGSPGPVGARRNLPGGRRRPDGRAVR